LLTELGIEHDYVPVHGGHCPYAREEKMLEFMDEKLDFKED